MRRALIELIKFNFRKQSLDRADLGRSGEQRMGRDSDGLDFFSALVSKARTTRLVSTGQFVDTASQVRN